MTEIQKLAKIMVLKDLLKECESLAKHDDGIAYDRYRALDMAIKALEQEPKTGHWICLEDEYGDVVDAVCSSCGANGNPDYMRYCPSCGAKMESEEQI